MAYIASQSIYSDMALQSVYVNNEPVIVRQFTDPKLIASENFEDIRVKIVENVTSDSAIVIPQYSINNIHVTQFKAEIDCISNDDFMATFQGTNISVSENSLGEAVQALKLEVVELYELLKAEPKLGVELGKTLSILEKHIVQGWE